MLNLVGLHALAALGAWISSRRLGRQSWLVAATAPAAAIGWAVWRTPGVVGGESLIARMGWVDQLGLAIELRVDALALLMVYVISVVGLITIGYSGRYAASSSEAGRLVAGLTVFAGAMLGIVFADNVFLLWGFWEITTLLSYLLIAFHHGEEAARSAARKALLVNAGGGLAMLAGLALLANGAGTTSLSSILRLAPDGIWVALALILVGVVVKSAQVPLHGWLPAAMVAPTPVSAYLHAAAMVKAGPYLLLRLAPLVAGITWWPGAVAAIGLTSAIFGGYRAMRVTDLKELLAYTTIAELGLMFVLVSVGTPEATAATLLLLVSHAAFKGCLFMATGIVDHHFGSRRLDTIRGLLHRLPLVTAAGALAVASMAGLPPFLGYIAEDEGFKALTAGPWGGWTWPLLVGVAAATVLKAAFSTRLVLATLGSPDATGPPSASPGPGWVLPPLLLAAAGLVLGLAPNLVGRLVESVVEPIEAGAAGLDIGLWHGFTPALGLTIATLVLGVLAATYRPGWDRLSSLTARIPRLDGEADRLLRGVNSTGRWIGSTSGRAAILPGVVAGAMVAAATALFTYDGGSTLRLPTNLAVVALAGLVTVTSVCVVLARRRMPAILLLSATGYGVALLYLVLEAPNLTLTQLLVETLLLVVLLTVAWRLPRPAPLAHKARRLIRLSMSVLAGAGLTAAVGLTYQTGITRPVSLFYATRREVGVEISNIVTAILVDFRALDTMGELTVLISAALALLVLYPLVDPRRLTPILTGQRSSVLAVAVDVLYPPVLLFGVYLFFAGHIGVGGGFPAGLVAAVALVLRHAAREPELMETHPSFPGKMVGTAAVMAAATALWGWAVGDAFLQNLDLSFHLPLVGEVAASSSLVFEAALAVAVTGLALTVLTRLDRMRR